MKLPSSPSSPSSLFGRGGLQRRLLFALLILTGLALGVASGVLGTLFGGVGGALPEEGGVPTRHEELGGELATASSVGSDRPSRLTAMVSLSTRPPLEAAGVPSANAQADGGALTQQHWGGGPRPPMLATQQQRPALADGSGLLATPKGASPTPNAGYRNRKGHAPPQEEIRLVGRQHDGAGGVEGIGGMGSPYQNTLASSSSSAEGGQRGGAGHNRRRSRRRGGGVDAVNPSDGAGVGSEGGESAIPVVGGDGLPPMNRRRVANPFQYMSGFLPSNPALNEVPNVDADSAVFRRRRVYAYWRPDRPAPLRPLEGDTLARGGPAILREEQRGDGVAGPFRRHQQPQEGEGSVFSIPPIGEPHLLSTDALRYPFYGRRSDNASAGSSSRGGGSDDDDDTNTGGGEYVDEATRIMQSITEGPTFPPTSSPPSVPFDKYRYPEDADTLAVAGSIWHHLASHYRNAKLETVLDADGNGAACMLSVVYTRGCEYLDESLEGCLARQGGADRLAFALSARCREGRWWRDFAAASSSSSSKGTGASRQSLSSGIDSGLPNRRRREEGAEVSEEGRPPLYRGLVLESEVCPRNRPDLPPYVPRANRTLPPMGPPRHCWSGALQYPAHFAGPVANVDAVLLPKLWDVMPLPIGEARSPDAYPLLHNDEDVLRALYKMSYFCMTHARGGWDCARHTEMMSAGCIPMFYDIHAAGPFILPHYPKRFLMDVVKLPLFAHLGYVTGAVGDHYQYLTTAASAPRDAAAGGGGGSSLSGHGPASGSVGGSSRGREGGGAAGAGKRRGRPHEAAPQHEANATNSTNAPSTASTYPIRGFLQETRGRVMFLREPYRFAGAGNGSSAQSSSPPPQLDKEWYWRSSRQLTEYTRKYLSAEAMVAYMLDVMGVGERGPPNRPPHVLVKARGMWDNMQQGIIAGLDGLGVRMTIVMEAHNTEEGEEGRTPRQLIECMEEDGRDGRGGEGHPDGDGREGRRHRPLLLSSADVASLRTRNSRRKAHGGGFALANRVRGRATFVNSLEEVLPMAQRGEFDAALFLGIFVEDFPADFGRPIPRRRPPPLSSGRQKGTSVGRGISTAGEERRSPVGSAVRPISAASSASNSSSSSSAEAERAAAMRAYLTDAVWRALKGRMGVVDVDDTREDPRSHSVTVAKHAYFFSRELRGVFC